MSFNGSGTFNINSAGMPVVAGTVISSTAQNALNADLAVGLSSVITKNGETVTTGVIPFAQGIAVTGDATISGDLTISGSLHAKTPVIDLADYSPAGDGSDDLGPLTNFFNDVMASANRIGIMGAKTYGISAALPQITTGCRIIGTLPSIASDGTPGPGTWIKKIGVTTNVDMITISPVADANNYPISGMVFTGVGFDANSGTGRARTCVIWNSTSASELEVRIGGEPSTCGVKFGAVTPLKGIRDPQRNRIRLYGYMTGTAGPCWIEGGLSDCDSSLNVFEIIDVAHSNTYAAVTGPGDNNQYITVRFARLGGGSATYCWNFLGSNSSAGEAANYYRIFDLVSDTPIIVRSTGFTYPAKWIKILSLQRSNGTPDPVVESGASCFFEADNTPIFDGTVLTDSPTVTSDTDPPTTVSGATRYQLTPNGIKILSMIITLTTLGPATGALHVTLPSGYAGKTGPVQPLSGGNLNTGVGCWGYIASGSSFIRIVSATGAFPLANGQSLTISGEYEITATPA